MKYLATVTLLLATGCASTAAPPPPVGMPNPASVHCQDQGGKLEIRTGPDGQTGYCHLPDGRVIEEWELYRSQGSVRPAGT
ncbi:MAG: DUF333 domain-containing protein [Sphingobium sp.]